VTGRGRTVGVQLHIAEIERVAGAGAYEEAKRNVVSVVATPPPDSATAKTRPSSDGSKPLLTWRD
jgi:hypothetical protein